MLLIGRTQGMVHREDTQGWCSGRTHRGDAQGGHTGKLLMGRTHKDVAHGDT